MKVMVAVQPRSLVTVPEHVSGALQDDVIVQVLRIVASSWKTSFVLAHSPFDVAAYVPLISGWFMSARAEPAPGPPTAVAATSVAPAITPIERTDSLLDGKWHSQK